MSEDSVWWLDGFRQDNDASEQISTEKPELARAKALSYGTTYRWSADLFDYTYRWSVDPFDYTYRWSADPSDYTAF